MLFKCYVKNKVREVIVAQDMPVNSALDFLRDYYNGVVRDSADKLITKEELENVKSFGSRTRAKPDNRTASERKISKGTDRKLSIVTTDNTE